MSGPLGLMEPPVPAEVERVKVGISGALGFGEFKIGRKLTLPKLKSFFKS